MTPAYICLHPINVTGMPRTTSSNEMTHSLPGHSTKSNYSRQLIIDSGINNVHDFIAQNNTQMTDTQCRFGSVSHRVSLNASNIIIIIIMCRQSTLSFRSLEYYIAFDYVDYDDDVDDDGGENGKQINMRILCGRENLKREQCATCENRISYCRTILYNTY